MHWINLTQRDRRITAIGAVCLAILIAAPLLTPALADSGGSERKVVARGAERSAPVTPYVFDGDLRDLPRPVLWQPGDPIREIPRRAYVRPGTKAPLPYDKRIDPLWQLQLESLTSTREPFTDLSRNIPGQGYSGVNPPDTNGEAGPNHYIQTINDGGGSIVAIYDKAQPTPNEVTTFMMDSLGTGVCASGKGDPIVLYDRYSGRWMLSEFSSSGNNLCVYISQTGDPVSGGWHFYGFTAPNFPDYPKYAIWPTDANGGGGGSIIVTSNESGPPAGYALDRGAMLNGDPATFQRVTFSELSGFSFQSTTPADPDGPNAPASGDPAIIMRQRDTENHGGPVAPGDLLEMWSFDVDWVNEANTTLTEEPSIDVAEFDSDLCGLTAFACFPQPDTTTTTLDPLREVIMWRLQYMNHDDFETLVGNFVTDLDGNDHGGIRWFELRRSGGGAWGLHQEGSYSIDADHRWMAASAMDQSQNIALGYNISSDTTYPSLRYTGRLADDPLGVMSQPETVIHAGTSNNSSNRYGDYSAMSLDPEDDCTFWFTGMDNTSTSWRTQIASFRFEACGCELLPLPLTVGASIPGDNRVELTWDDSELDTIEEYLVLRSRTAGGPYDRIATVSDSSPGLPGGPGYVYEDRTVSGGITYYYVVRASDGAACKSSSTNEVSITATGSCTLAPRFDGLQEVSTPFFGVCTLDLFWDAASAECVGSITYNVYRSSTPGFTPGPGNLLVGGITNTTLSDLNGLVHDTTYYYVVRAVDDSNGVEEANLVEDSGTPLGQVSTITWTDDAGDTDSAKLTPETPWQVDPTEGNLGPNVYKTGDYGNSTCAGLVTPQLHVNTGSTLTFWSRYEFENSYDKGEVQVSTDGGLLWERVEMAYPGTSTNASDNCGLPTGTYFTGTNLDWAEYTADLTPWANQDVLLRFVISSDSSQTRQGWWIDDIIITLIGPADVCATGSSCEDNPFVDVDPEGPITECSYNSPTLTVNTTSGTPPFVYQWFENGEVIPGATGASFLPQKLGTNRYNVKVKSETCDDDVADGLDTEITLVNQPYFDGVKSAIDPQYDTCTIAVDWDPGSSVCDGPVEYVVYRDTVPGFTPTPDKLVASGLTATSLDDSAGLIEGETYYYMVRSIDRSTSRFDDNVAVASAAPTGPGTGIYAIFSDDFENPATFSDWTVLTGPGAHTCGDWERSSGPSERPSGGSGSYALSKSEDCPSLLPLTSTSIDSPVIDLSISGIASVTLEHDIFYKYFNGGDDATVEVYDGSAWVVLWEDSNVDFNGHQVFDVTAYAAGNSEFRIRYNYQLANSDKWFSMDNVEVIVDIYNPCATLAGPPPAPDGRGGSSPLHGNRTSASGDSLDVTWDVSSCTASEYNLLYGDLTGLSTYTLDGSVCSIGTSGSYSWSSVPAGSLYFLVVGADGGGTESSWGIDGASTERNGMSPSGECSVVIKDISNYCP